MPNTHSTLTSLFSDIADAIRVKKGTSADIVADNFPDEIASITGGGAGGDYNIEVVDDGEGGQILNITDAEGGGGGITDYDIGYTYPSAVHRLHIPYNPNKTPAFVVCFSKAAWQAGGKSCGGVAFKDVVSVSTSLPRFMASITLGSKNDELYYGGITEWSSEQSTNCITLDRMNTSFNWDTNLRVDYFIAYDADNTLHWRDNS